MPAPALSAAVSRVRRAVADPPSDGRLVAAFVATRDEAAFAELVARHGPMVFAVCRKLTGHRQDAEDAFQAAFVVLARRADAVVPAEAVGNWLYGVAVRVARDARKVAARRRSRETPVAVVPEPPAHDGRPPEPDDAAVVHEELARLPDKFRTLLVLCDLQGRPQTEAADRLGLPVGTVYSRLAAARKALADRLRRRGVAAPAVLATVAIPPDLIARTLPMAAGPVPAAVAALSHGVTRTMFLHKLTAAVTLGVVAAGLAGGLLLAAGSDGSTPEAGPPAAPAKPAADPKPRAKGPNKILIFRGDHLALIDPDGKNERRVTENRGEFRPGAAKLSPDGTAYATLIRVGQPEDPPARQLPRFKLYVRKRTDPEPGKDLGVEPHGFCWSPDGTRLAVSELVDASGTEGKYDHFLVDIKTGRKTALKLPANHTVTGWPDGDTLVTSSVDNTPGRPRSGLHLMNPDGTERRALTDGQTPTGFGVLSPDGKRLLALQGRRPGPGAPPGAPPAAVQTLVLIDVATGEATPVEGYPERTVGSQNFCWSPDGQKIAYVWHEVEGDPDGKPTASHLVVCDPDGKNAKTILTEKVPGQWALCIAGPDWR